jgi:NAD(P)-dependent dehydrogenase (short-subunit alcohol dehydrogenase family)
MKVPGKVRAPRDRVRSRAPHRRNAPHCMQTFLITGGVSGLGLSVGRYFVGKGANVVLADLDEKVRALCTHSRKGPTTRARAIVQTGKEVVAELGAKAVFVKCDVTNEAQVRNVRVLVATQRPVVQVKAAVDAAVSSFGTVHGLINCAGIGKPMRVLSKDGKPHDEASFVTVNKINLFGSFNALRLAAAQMAKNTPEDGERGTIINVASVAAFEGQIGQASYSASKGAIVGA